MKKLTAALLLILTIVFVAFTINFHKNLIVDNDSQAKIAQNTPQGILPGGCVVNPSANAKFPKEVMGVGLVCVILSAVLSLICLFDKSKKQVHTDEEYTAKADELSQTLAKLNDSLADNEKLKSDLETNKVDSEKLSKLQDQLMESEKQNEANMKTISEQEAVLAKTKAEAESFASRAENLEKDNKGVKREVDKLNSMLKNNNKEKEELKVQLIELQKKLEEQIEAAKAVEANSKGGKDAIPPAAYQILYLLQKEGRLIDLLNEDVSEVDDESLGGAVRPVLEGCAKLLKDRLIVEPVLNDEEGSEVTVEEADPETIKLSGNVPASGPYKGELIHHGWRLKECNLPELVDGWKGNVIAPAEIEI